MRIHQQISTRAWWRRVNPTLVAMVIAFGAVAVIGWKSADTPPKRARTSAELTSAGAAHKLEPGAFVGALLPPRYHQRKRAHVKKRAPPPSKASDVQSARPVASA